MDSHDIFDTLSMSTDGVPVHTGIQRQTALADAIERTTWDSVMYLSDRPAMKANGARWNVCTVLTNSYAFALFFYESKSKTVLK
ncbi:hypothetical protein Trydic_g15141 [Trypoxylus dichotomus]